MSASKSTIRRRDETTIKRAIEKAESEVKKSDPMDYGRAMGPDRGGVFEQSLKASVDREMELTKARPSQETLKNHIVDLQLSAFQSERHVPSFEVVKESYRGDFSAIFRKYGGENFIPPVKINGNSDLVIIGAHCCIIAAELGQLWYLASHIAYVPAGSGSSGTPPIDYDRKHFAENELKVVVDLTKQFWPRLEVTRLLNEAARKVGQAWGQGQKPAREKLVKYVKEAGKNFKMSLMNISKAALSDEDLLKLLMELAMALCEFSRILYESDLTLTVLKALVGSSLKWDAWIILGLVAVGTSTVDNSSTLDYLSGGYAFIPHLVLALLRSHSLLFEVQELERFYVEEEIP